MEVSPIIKSGMGFVLYNMYIWKEEITSSIRKMQILNFCELGAMVANLPYLGLFQRNSN